MLKLLNHHVFPIIALFHRFHLTRFFGEINGTNTDLAPAQSFTMVSPLSARAVKLWEGCPNA
jgi:hypothetical protein